MMNNLYNKIYEAVNTGIQKALILDLDNDVSVKFHNKEISTEFIPYEYRTVDMGTDILWCEYNLGAFPGNKPKDWYGDYYAWGETKTKDIYSWESYKYCNGSYDTLTKYQIKTEYDIPDNMPKLESCDDVIQEALGNKYRIPTKDEYINLLNNTTNEWVKNYQEIHGLNGILFTAKNSNTLFFPAAGCYYDDECYYNGKQGYIWSSSLYSEQPFNASFFKFLSDEAKVKINERYFGFSIRGVSSKL